MFLLCNLKLEEILCMIFSSFVLYEFSVVLSILSAVWISTLPFLAPNIPIIVKDCYLEVEANLIQSH